MRRLHLGDEGVARYIARSHAIGSTAEEVGELLSGSHV